MQDEQRIVIGICRKFLYSGVKNDWPSASRLGEDAVIGLSSAKLDQAERVMPEAGL